MRFYTYPVWGGSNDVPVTLASVASGPTAKAGPLIVNPAAETGILYLFVTSVTGSACGVRPSLYQSYNGTNWFLNTSFGNAKLTSTGQSVAWPVSNLGKHLSVHYVVTSKRREPVATSFPGHLAIKAYLELKSYE